MNSLEIRKQARCCLQFWKKLLVQQRFVKRQEKQKKLLDKRTLLKTQHLLENLLHVLAKTMQTMKFSLLKVIQLVEVVSKQEIDISKLFCHFVVRF